MFHAVGVLNDGVAKADKLDVHVWIMASDSKGGAVINLFKESFNGGSDAPVGAHFGVILGQIISSDLAIGREEVLDNGMGAHQSKTIGSVLERDDKALLSGCQEEFLETAIKCVIQLEMAECVRELLT